MTDKTLPTTTTNTPPAPASPSAPITPTESWGGKTALTAAFKQWMNRPADERFSSLEALHEACAHHREVSIESVSVPMTWLRIEAAENADGSGTHPVLVGSSGQQARFTHYAFGQFARRVGAPAAYLRTLPTALVRDNLNVGMQRLAEVEADPRCTLLFAKNGDLRLRALTSPSYSRIWNVDITSRLLRLVEAQPQWQPAPAAFDGSRGLYASDADMFAFLVDNDRRIFESLPGGGLGRGFFVENSEVGAGAFKVTTFFYEYVCGNHRVWGASGVQQLSIRHVGKADERAFDEMSVELRKYADASAKDDEARITAMRTKVLGKDKDSVLDAVFGLRGRDVSRKVLEQSYDVAVEHEDWYGNPNTVWGLTGGMTQVARDLANASDRVAMERMAGRIMQMAF